LEAILKYKLPEEESNFRVAAMSMDWALALWDLDQHLRSLLKYGHEFKSADEALEAVREHLHDLMEEREISFNHFD